MTEKARVLYLETSTEGTIGGSHHSLYQLVRAVQSYNIEPIVVFYEDNDLISYFQDIGCEVYILDKPERTVIRRRPEKFKKLVRFIESALYFLHLSTVHSIKHYLWMRKHRVELVHLNNNPFSMDWLVASKLARIPCVAHQRGIREHLDRSEIAMANSMNRVFCISQYVWKSLELSGCNARNFTLIHNGVDTAVFSPNIKNADLMKTLNIGKDHVVIGMIGNIKEWKGQHILVEAIGEVVKSHPNVVVLFVGKFDRSSKEYESRILSLAEDIGVTDNLIFTGYTPNIKEHITLMDIVVHASIQPEPFGRVIIEAMSMGKPVIASNDGGVKEIVEHKASGILFEPGDSGALAAHITDIIESPETIKSLSFKARQHVMDRFSIESNAKQTVEVYRQLIKSPSRLS